VVIRANSDTSATLLGHVLHVDRGIAGKQMRRVAARRIVAMVAYHIRLVTVNCLKHDDMGLSLHIIRCSHTIRPIVTRVNPTACV